MLWKKSLNSIHKPKPFFPAHVQKRSLVVVKPSQSANTAVQCFLCFLWLCYSATDWSGIPTAPFSGAVGMQASAATWLEKTHLFLMVYKNILYSSLCVQGLHLQVCVLLLLMMMMIFFCFISAEFLISEMPNKRRCIKVLRARMGLLLR